MEKNFDGRSIELTHLDKVLFPNDGFTKADLISYYEKIADVILPHLSGRPISMERFPNGIGKPSFYQKKVPQYFPEWIDTAVVEKSGGVQEQVVCNDKATLVYLVNQACITQHVWMSRREKLRYPDKYVIDLDPPSSGSFEQVRKAAFILRKLLFGLGLDPYVMTTGSRGLHVTIPLDRKHDFDFIREFSNNLSSALEARAPDVFTREMRKSKRNGLIFIDTMRNAYAQTAASPYSVRPLDGALVAMPITWSELEKKSVSPSSFSIKNTVSRLMKIGDPWLKIYDNPQSLDGAKRILEEMSSRERRLTVYR